MEAKVRCIFYNPELDEHTYELSIPTRATQTFEVDGFDCSALRCTRDDAALEIAKSLCAALGLPDLDVKLIV